jgi:hypothetical protein
MLLSFRLRESCLRMGLRWRVIWVKIVLVLKEGCQLGISLCSRDSSIGIYWMIDKIRVVILGRVC